MEPIVTSPLSCLILVLLCTLFSVFLLKISKSNWSFCRISIYSSFSIGSLSQLQWFILSFFHFFLLFSNSFEFNLLICSLIFLNCFIATNYTSFFAKSLMLETCLSIVFSSFHTFDFSHYHFIFTESSFTSFAVSFLNYAVQKCTI